MIDPKDLSSDPGDAPESGAPAWRTASVWASAALTGIALPVLYLLAVDWWFPGTAHVHALLAVVGATLLTAARGHLESQAGVRHLADQLDRVATALERGQGADIETHDLEDALAGPVNRLLGASAASLFVTEELAADVGRELTDLAGEADMVQSELEEATRDARRGRTSVQEAESYAQEVARTAQVIAGNASEVRDAVEGASVTCKDGVLGVRDAVAGMDRIRSQVETIAQRMGRLGEATARIESVVKFIQDISRQTDLLALNAAIEAAGAGEAGDRFGVVAVEVKRLAERTTEATGSIKGLVEEIQAEATAATAATKAGTEIAAEGEELVRRVGEALQRMFQEVARTSRAASGIGEVAGAQVDVAESMSVALAGAANAAEKLDKASGKAVQVSGELARRARTVAADAHARTGQAG